MESKKNEFKNTLSLISVARYNNIYQSLKEKYKEIVKVSIIIYLSKNFYFTFLPRRRNVYLIVFLSVICNSKKAVYKIECCLYKLQQFLKTHSTSHQLERLQEMVGQTIQGEAPLASW